MAQDVTAIERIAGRPIGVEPAAIEDEFARIWRETAGDTYDASSIRLRVLNLVGIGNAADAETRYERVMEAMPQRYPCRGILALLDPAVADVTASISAHCWSSATGGRHVCSEEVLLRGGPAQGRAVASAVLALLVPEVPVDVWLIGPPDLQGELLDEVLEAADRLLLDSGAATEAAATYRDALAIANDRGLAICDLAWHRLVAWRTLTAQFFDGEGARQELTRLQSIEVAGGAGRPSSEALLLAGWFVSRLGLSPADVSVRGGGFDATLYDGTRGIRLAVAPGDSVMRSVRIRTQNALFLVESHEASGHMHVREEWPDASPHRTVAMRPVDDASVVVEALDDPDDASVFIDAMRAALTLSESAPDATGSPPASA